MIISPCGAGWGFWCAANTGGTSRNALPSLWGARLSSLVLAGRGRPHLSFEIPLSQDVEAQGLEALLQLLAVHVGAFSSRHSRVAAEVDVVEDQAASTRISFQLINLAGTRRN